MGSSRDHYRPYPIRGRDYGGGAGRNREEYGHHNFRGSRGGGKGYSSFIQLIYA
jgi:hypothetical protein